MIQTTTTTKTIPESVAPKALSRDDMRLWAFEKLSEMAARLGDSTVVLPIEAYIQSLEASLDLTEKRLQISERENCALFTKVVMSEHK